jgi:hypothetical protein
MHAALALTTTAVYLPTQAHAAAAPQVVNFAASDVDIANPGRGFYRYSETHLSGSPGTYQRLDPVLLADQRSRGGTTLIFRYFYLDGYRDRDTITPLDLGLVRADLVAARQAGVKMIIRFAYSSSSSADAPADRVKAHIRQLAPVLNENADVIAALQAGFIGRWGEWYYTDNFASDPAQPWKLTDADWQARQQVLRALLDNTRATIPIQVRYPAIRQRMEMTLTAADAARLGIHDDCFLAGTDDYGTFTGDADREWLAVRSRTTITGGESCAVNAPRSQWENASAELARYHYTFLNADYHPDVLASWGGGRAEAARRLGYRLRLAQTTTPVGTRPGDATTVRIRLVNTGYAAPIANRPVNLILQGPGAAITVKVSADTRTWAPGQDIDLVVTFRAPSQVGRYQLLLNMPDSVTALADQLPLINGDTTNSAYAIRLANPGMWTTQGFNDLQTALVVSTG